MPPYTPLHPRWGRFFVPTIPILRPLWALAPHAPQQVGAAPCTPAGAISFPQTP
jgi:hypothetical protein